MDNLKQLEEDYLKGEIHLDNLLSKYIEMPESEALKHLDYLKSKKGGRALIQEMLKSKYWDSISKKLSPYILKQNR